MNYLLDTHALIWFFEDSPQLSKRMWDIIAQPENEIYVHIISLWEIAIKMSLGRLKLGLSFSKLVAEIKDGNFHVLPIEDRYLHTLMGLPFVHNDPFDRLLIAAALTEGHTIITKDENIHKYDVSWMW